MNSSSFTCVVLAAFATAVAGFSPSASAAEKVTSPWQPGFTIAPYAWIAGFEGTFSTNSGPIDPGGGLGLPPLLSLSTDNDLDEIGFMTYAEWRGERWYTSFDFVWFDVSQDGNLALGSIIAASTAEVELSGNVYQLDVGYRLTDWQKTSIAMYGGLRYYDVDITLSLQGGLLPNPVSSTNSDNWTDAVIGARWAHIFNDRWNLFALTDYGFGDSDSSWQIFTALGYNFNWGSLELGYRYLHVDYTASAGDLDIDLYGPLFGASFRFK